MIFPLGFNEAENLGSVSCAAAIVENIKEMAKKAKFLGMLVITNLF
jgi:hypothetical protein